MKHALCILALAVPATGARGETFSVPIDSSTSSVTITLNLLGGSATDSSPVAGFMNLKLEIVSSPMQATLNDFDFVLTEPIVLNISYGFPIFGNFNSTLTDYRLYYATPGTPTGPAAIGAGGAFAFLNVPALQEGMLNYNATGGVCTIFQINSIPCTSSVNLADQPDVTISQMGGTLTSAGRVVSIVSTFDETSPIDPSNPNLGSIRLVGTIRGSVFVPPIPGDANGDCVVDFGDVTSVLANYGGSGPDGDGDSNGSVDFGDITAALAGWGGMCD